MTVRVFIMGSRVAGDAGLGDRNGPHCGSRAPTHTRNYANTERSGAQTLRDCWGVFMNTVSDGKDQRLLSAGYGYTGAACDSGVNFTLGVKHIPCGPAQRSCSHTICSQTQSCFPVAQEAHLDTENTFSVSIRESARPTASEPIQSIVNRERLQSKCGVFGSEASAIVAYPRARVWPPGTRAHQPPLHRTAMKFSRGTPVLQRANDQLQKYLLD
ncbi:unnamed protein product [Leuciscus chuanchicus]